jgi:hypothetical protein
MVREARARGGSEDLPIPLGVREIIRQRLAHVTTDVRRHAGEGLLFGCRLFARICDLPDVGDGIPEQETRGRQLRLGASQLDMGRKPKAPMF